MIEMKCAVGEALAEILEEVLGEWEDAPFSVIRELEKGGVELHGYFQTQEEGKILWEQLRGYVKGLPEATETLELEDRDWQEAYKAYLKPWVYKELHWVPVWEKGNYRVPVGEYAVYLDAGMAFGTGAHETTRLCGMRLMDYFLNNKEKIDEITVIDAGCGSGILALTAVALGFRKVYAFDIDPDAIIVVEQNAGHNDLENKVELRVSGLKEGLEGRKAEFIVANIQADVLCKHVNELMGAVKPGGELILSGILAVEIKTVLEAFMESNKLKQWQSLTMGEWGDLRLY